MPVPGMPVIYNLCIGQYLRQERRELLSKATLAVAEHSMALNEAQEGTEKVKEELELERQETARLRLKLKEARTFGLRLCVQRRVRENLNLIPFTRGGPIGFRQALSCENHSGAYLEWVDKTLREQMCKHWSRTEEVPWAWNGTIALFLTYPIVSLLA